MQGQGHVGLSNRKVNEATSGDFFGVLSVLKTNPGTDYFVIHVYSNTFHVGPWLERSNIREIPSGRPSQRENFLERMGFEFYSSCNVLRDGRCYYKVIEEISRGGSLSFDWEDSRRVQLMHDSFKKFIANLQGIFDRMLEIDKMLFEAGIELPWADLRLAPVVYQADEKVYRKGEVYDFYKDVRDISQHANNEVFFLEPYPDEEILNLHLEKIPEGVKIRILTNKPHKSNAKAQQSFENFVAIARKFKAKPGVAFEVRESGDCHDRIFFVDGECWVMGQSLKDAGKKPTYLIKIESSAVFRKVFDDLWSESNLLV